MPWASFDVFFPDHPLVRGQRGMPSLRCSRCRRTGTQIHPVDKYEVFIPVFGEDIGSSFDHASRLCE
jgi:hypothetical protein